MPMQPKGFRWGAKTLFGNKHGQKGGCAVLAIMMFAAPAIWSATVVLT